MHKILFVIVAGSCLLTSCSKSPSPAASSGGSVPGSTSSSDPVQQKLQALAGDKAKNCGIFKSQATADLEVAGKCAMDSSKARSPFFVEYQMPGMNVAVAGNAEGKLYTVQSQDGGAGLVTADCPAELRVAPSGRVTCYAPGTFPMGAGASTHNSMPIPPMMGSGTKNPHGGAGTLPAGHPEVRANPKPQPPSN